MLQCQPILGKATKASWALLSILLLVGCGAQSVRDSADALLKAGQYEKALSTYDDGIARHPDSVVLRSGQATAKGIAFSRLMDSAQQARRSGNYKGADDILQRALAINPNDERAQALRLDVARDVRLDNAFTMAQELIAQGLRERAMLTVEAGLKDNPRHAPLMDLQRQLELDAQHARLISPRLSEARTVSLDFRDANLRTVLDLLTRSNGINFVLDKDLRQDARATVFMRQARLEDALELITSTNQLAYKVIDPVTVLIYPKTPEKLKEYQDLLIRAFYLTSADAKQTALMLKSMLKIHEPFVDDKLNLITIRETPEVIRLAERLIALHDQAEPEVMLDVEVLEVKRSSLTELGIKYPDAFTLTPIAPPAGFTLGNVRNINRDTIGVNVPNVTINLHRDVGDVHILANPKIRARNHEKAKVLIGDKLPVVTTTGSAGNSAFFSESVQYVDVGLKLDVEPTVHLNDEVAIKVGLEVSSLVREIKTSGGSLVYQIGTRTANTVLRLRDGETQLLAGLINNEERSSANRIPGIGDLPVLGRLFSSERDDRQRTEIVLSVTPRILRNIRRPDLNQAEFWSGTENDVRSRPFVPVERTGAGDAKRSPGDKPSLAPTEPPTPSAGPQDAPAPLAISLVAPGDVKRGDRFTVFVNVKSEVALRGLPVQLLFDPAMLEVQDVEEGAYFKRDGAATSKTKVLEQAQGRASMALIRNVGSGSSGDGTAMAFHFLALKSGNTELRLAPGAGIASQGPNPVATAEPVKISLK